MLVENKTRTLFASRRDAMLVEFVLVSGFHQHGVPNGTEKNIDVMTTESINILY
jgi:hypothetical protein